MKKKTKIIIPAIMGIVAIIIIAGIKTLNMNSKKEALGVATYINENKDTKPISFVIKKNGEILISINADMQMPLASMSKWTIAIEYARQVGQGIIDPNEIVDMIKLEQYYIARTDGNAHPKWISSISKSGQLKNNQTTIREVAKGMMAFSSNANTDYLINRLGIDNINNTIKDMGLTHHSDVYPIVAALCMGDYIQQETGLKEADVKEMLIKMSDEEYISKTMKIHELMNKNMLSESVRAVPLVLNSFDFQQIWSDRFISATANDYIYMMGLINSGTYFDKATQEELRNVAEYIMETTGMSTFYKHYGIKSGSTAWVITTARYIEDVNGNKMEIVLMMNDLDKENYQNISKKLESFITSIINDKRRESIINIIDEGRLSSK